MRGWFSMKKIDTLIFDLDGTLVKSIPIIRKSFRSAFKRHFPETEFSDEKIDTFIGPTLYDTFSEYTKDPFEIQDMIDSYREFYVKHERGNIELYPDVLEVVKDLHSKGYNLAILTSKFAEAAWPSFTESGLSDFFHSFTALDHVPNPKPSRDAVDVVMAKYPDSVGAIMIGDTKGDILAGINAEIYSAGVAWSFKGAAYLMEANPDFMLANIEDIFRIIKLIEEE